jgi:hypothetical protein
MRNPCAVLLAALLLPFPATAQTLSLPTSSLTDSSNRAAAIARLASDAAAVYRDSNRIVQLDELFRLQFLAGRPNDARVTLAQLRSAQVALGDTTPKARALNAQYEIYFEAKQLQSDSSMTFADAFARAFRHRFARLDDRTAALVARTLSVTPPPPPDTPWGSAGNSASDTTVALADAVTWLRAMQIAQT